MHRLRSKRIQDAPAASDGVRVPVDRRWPRGLGKERAYIDHWLKAIAPSSRLGKWYDHDAGRRDALRRRYFIELSGRDEPVIQHHALIERHAVALLYSTRSETHNDAAALVDFLHEK
jgi:uncharacterized protein YeaO (DUF488 family)